MTKRQDRKKRGIFFRIVSTISVAISATIGISVKVDVPTWFWIFLAVCITFVVADLIDGGLHD